MPRHVRVGLLVGVVLAVTVPSIAYGLPTVSVSSETAMEADGKMTFTIMLSEPSASVVHVGYYTTDGTATSPDDYTHILDGQNFPAGTTSRTFDVPIHSDWRVEEDETFTVGLINVNGATWDGSHGVGTITDNPRASISDATASEDVGVMTFTITLSHASPQSIHVGYGTRDGEAIEPADYTHVLDGQGIPPGHTSTTFDVPIVDDAIYEGDETFDVFLINVTGAGVADSTGVGTIVDDERSVSIFSMSANEDEGVVRLQIILTSPSALPVLVWTSSEDVTARSPDDYTWGLVPVTIPAGDMATILEIPIVDDAKFEEREYFKVHIATFPEATGQGTALGIIDDNDGSVSIADATADEDAGTMTFTATLSQPAPSPVDITFLTTDGTAHAPDDYTDTFAAAQFLLGSTTATFDVPIVDDVLGEADEQFNVLIMNVLGSTTIEGMVGQFWVDIADGQAVGTIVDNEASVSIGDATAGEGAGTMAFTVTLSRANSTPVEVTLQTSDDTAVAPGDYTRTHEDLEIPVGRTTATFRVPIIDDAETESDETFDVYIDTAVGAAVEDGVGIGTITDNEPTVSVGDATTEEGDGAIAFPVTLSHGSSSTVHVALQTEDGTAVAPDDYTQKVGDVEIGPGSTSAMFRVPIANDSLDELDETFKVQIGSVVGGDVSDGEAVGTIADDDGPEIDVQRPVGASIPDGGNDDIGSVPAGLVDLTYVLDNTAGAGPLDVPFVGFSNRMNLDDITVVNRMPLHVEAGATADLYITINVTGEGAFGVDVAVANNDLDENLYDLALRGRVLRVGDVNGDGAIDVLDVRICFAIASGSLKPTGAQATQADVDIDGDVDIDDARWLAEIVLGID